MCEERVSKREKGTSLVVQCLRLCAPNAGRMASIPDWGDQDPSWLEKKRERETDRQS